VLAGAWLQGGWIALIGFFLRNAAQASYQQLMIRRALEGVSVSQIMSEDVVCVPGDVTIGQAVDDWFLKYRYDAFGSSSTATTPSPYAAKRESRGCSPSMTHGA